MSDIDAVVTDLFFQARISAAARAAGLTVQFLTGLGQIPEHVGGACVLVDLDAALDVTAAIERLKAAGARQIIAFGPHLDTERRKAARAAGADRVLAKSKFVSDLPAIIASTSPRSQP
jgi:DNA-binding LacI/PurR family transcriptional regulator